jgi:hypothetical protein
VIALETRIVTSRRVEKHTDAYWAIPKPYSKSGREMARRELFLVASARRGDLTMSDIEEELGEYRLYDTRVEEGTGSRDPQAVPVEDLLGVFGRPVVVTVGSARGEQDRLWWRYSRRQDSDLPSGQWGSAQSSIPPEVAALGDILAAQAGHPDCEYRIEVRDA